MTDYKKLVDALRCGEYKPECGSSDCPYWSGLGCMDGQLMEDAAAAIEGLRAEKNGIQGELDSLRVFADESQRRIEELQAELAGKNDAIRILKGYVEQKIQKLKDAWQNETYMVQRLEQHLPTHDGGVMAGYCDDCAHLDKSPLEEGGYANCKLMDMEVEAILWWGCTDWEKKEGQDANN